MRFPAHGLTLWTAKRAGNEKQILHLIMTTENLTYANFIAARNDAEAKSEQYYYALQSFAFHATPERKKTLLDTKGKADFALAHFLACEAYQPALSAKRDKLEAKHDKMEKNRDKLATKWHKASSLFIQCDSSDHEAFYTLKTASDASYQALTDYDNKMLEIALSINKINGDLKTYWGF